MKAQQRFDRSISLNAYFSKYGAQYLLNWIQHSNEMILSNTLNRGVHWLDGFRFACCWPNQVPSPGHPDDNEENLIVAIVSRSSVFSADRNRWVLFFSKIESSYFTSAPCNLRHHMYNVTCYSYRCLSSANELKLRLVFCQQPKRNQSKTWVKDRIAIHIQ